MSRGRSVRRPMGAGRPTPGVATSPQVVPAGAHREARSEGRTVDQLAAPVAGAVAAPIRRLAMVT